MRRAPGRVLVLLAALLLVNLPWAQRAWVDHRIAVAGHRVPAVVVATGVVRGGYVVRYRLAGPDAAGATFTARVDPATWRRARRAHRIPVLVVPGHQAQNRAVGEVGSALVWVVAAVGDLLIGAVVLLLFLRGRLQPTDRAA